MNCFTLEASFHAFITKDWHNIELTSEMYEKVGKVLGEALLESIQLVEEDEKQREELKE